MRETQRSQGWERMELVRRKLEEIREYPNNPRKNEQAADAVAESIRQCGYIAPIIVDECGVILAGHTRYKALQKLGRDEAEVVVKAGLTDEQKAKYRLLDNKTGELADWDFGLLEEELEGLDFGELELDWGVDMEEVPEVAEDDYEVVPPAEPRSRMGDIYQLGRHRLMCGDSIDKKNIDTLLDGERADMVFTDPPYDMEMGGQGCFKKSMQNCKGRIDSIIKFDPFVLSYLPELNINSFYIFTSKNGISKYIEIFKELNYDILCWCKTNPVPFTSGSFLPDVEYLMYFSRRGRVWNNSLKPTSIYRKYYVTQKLQGRIDGGGNLHPTMKPLEIIADKVRISSNEGGVVVDIFGGSGSTLMACEQVNRRCYMMEIDPRYVDTIIDRWEKFTGGKAVLLNEQR